jgi:Flp pilus assembly pilin Flp
MKFSNIFKSFANDEAGAVTVDWVVLTAAIVGLGIIVMTSVGGGVTTLGAAIATKVSSQTVGYVAP